MKTFEELPASPGSPVSAGISQRFLFTAHTGEVQWPGTKKEGRFIKRCYPANGSAELFPGIIKE